MVKQRMAQLAMLMLSESAILALATSSLKANECTPEVKGQILDSLAGMADRLEAQADALHMLAHVTEVSYPDIVDWAQGVRSAEANGFPVQPEELAAANALANIGKKGH